jgi:hypothetical protein
MSGWGVEIIADTFSPKLIGITERMRQNIVEEWTGVGGDMVDMARGLVRVRTGFLRDSIYFEPATDPLSFSFGARADYALWQEIGTRFMTGQPYIRPALDANQNRLLDAAVQGVMKAFQ